MLQEVRIEANKPEPGPGSVPGRASRSPVLLEVAILLLRAAEMVSVVATAWLAAAVALEFVPDHMAQAYGNAALIAGLFYAALAEVTGCYDIDTRFSVRTGWARVMTAWLSTGMFLMTLGFLLKVSEDFSRGWAVVWFLMGGVALLTLRAGGTAWMLRLKRRGVFNHRVAIFGAGSQGDRLATTGTQRMLAEDQGGLRGGRDLPRRRGSAAGVDDQVGDGHVSSSCGRSGCARR